MPGVRDLLSLPISYRLWQAPFADAKFAPVLRHNDLSRVKRVLDVGCGPGTNTKYFAEADYLGIDLNPRFIEDAKRRHSREFEVADATRFTGSPGEPYDFILVNSFLHHIADDEVRRLMSHLATLLAHDGHIHVMELELPERPSPARLLARMDRGDFPRPLDGWRELLAESFTTEVFEPYPLGRAGWDATTLWRMIYFKGSPPGEASRSAP